MSAAAGLSGDEPRPEAEARLAAKIRDAAARDEPLLVQGNGTKSGMLRPVQSARSISSSGLSGITFYSPKELVLSARAGTALPEIEPMLAEAGQHLVAEPPDLRGFYGTTGPQTLGGIVAANLSGPRRVVWGAMRDHVLGMRAVTGRGEVIRSGGRVLKNVTGLDLCKLLAGSHGTLGVITEVTLKVLPAPQATGTIIVPRVDAAAGVAALSAALGSPYGVSAAAWLPEEGVRRVPELSGFPGGIALVRIEDFTASVTYRTGRLREELGLPGVEILDTALSRAIWRAVRDATPLAADPVHAVWRVSVRPSAGPAVLEAVAKAGVRGFLDWGGGLVWLCGPAEPAAQSLIEAAARAAGGVWMLLRAPEPFRAVVNVVPPEPPALAAITRRVKTELDPKGILNPGRMYAGL